MSKDKLEEITDAIYFYGKDLTGDKKLVDYIDDLESLIKSQREEAVRGFYKYLTKMHNVGFNYPIVDEYLNRPDEATENTTGVLPIDKVENTADGSVVAISPSSDETTSDKWRTQGYVEESK